MASTEVISLVDLRDRGLARQGAEEQRRLVLSLLERRDRSSIVHGCFQAWRALESNRLKAQVSVVLERLAHAEKRAFTLEAEGARLRVEAERWRSEAHSASSRAGLAEAELRRRSGEEFANLRALERDLAVLRGEAAASAETSLRIPMTHWFPAMTTWLRLCVLAWRAKAQCAALSQAVLECVPEDDSQRRVMSAWRLLVEERQRWSMVTHLTHVTMWHLAAPLARVTLRAWWDAADRLSRMTEVSYAASPISCTNFHSVVVLSGRSDAVQGRESVPGERGVRWPWPAETGVLLGELDPMCAASHVKTPSRPDFGAL